MARLKHLPGLSAHEVGQQCNVVIKSAKQMVMQVADETRPETAVGST